MTALTTRRRRRTAFMLTANLLAIAGAVVMLVVGAVTLKHYKAANDVSDQRPVVHFPATPTAMLATTDATGRLSSVTVFVLRPDSNTGGSIVSVPVNADPTFGAGPDRSSLIDAYASGGAEGLMLAVESTLSLTIDVFEVADPAQVAGFLLPLAPLAVDLPADVHDTVDGADKVVIARGPSSLTAPQAAEVLNARGPDAREADRRPNLEALWFAVAKAVGNGKPPESMPAGISSFADFTSHLFAAPVSSRGLPTTQLTPAMNPQGLDIEAVDGAESVLVFAALAPSKMSAPAAGLNYRIEAPPGYEAQVKYVVSALLFFGDNVSSISFSGPKQAATVILVADDRFEGDTKRANELLGKVTYQRAEKRTEGIDVTIVLGADFLDAPLGPAPTSTTSTSEPATVGSGA